MTEVIHMTEAEQIELAHSMLDNAGIPRTEGERELSLVSRVSRLANPNPWRSIETAPEKKTDVLVRFVDGGVMEDFISRSYVEQMKRRGIYHWMPIPEVTR